VVKRVIRLLFGVCLTAAIVSVLYLYSSLQQSIAAQTTRPVCLSSGTASGRVAPACYSAPQILSSQETTAIAVSGDGQFLASSQRENIWIWDLHTGRPWRSLQGHKDWVSTLAFSPDGKTLASSSLDQTIKLWNWQTGKLLNTLPAGRSTSLEFSPDGQMLASGSRLLEWSYGKISPAGVSLWDLSTLKILRVLGTDAVNALAFNPDGKMLAAGNTHTELWETQTGTLLHTLNSGELTALAFTPDGKMLISSSKAVKFWYPESGKFVRSFSSLTADLAITTDGQSFATASGGTVYLWQLAPTKLLGGLRGSSYSRIKVVFALGNQAIISGSSDGLKVWRLQ
jgi:WD40 repeat protein